MSAIPVVHPFVHYHWIGLSVPEAKGGTLSPKVYHGPHDFAVLSADDIFFGGVSTIGRLVAGMRVKEGIASIIYNIYFHTPDQILYEVLQHDFVEPVRILRHRFLSSFRDHIKWVAARDIFPRANLGRYSDFPVAQFVC